MSDETTSLEPSPSGGNSLARNSAQDVGTVQSGLENADIEAIGPNPFRSMDDAPLSADKINALVDYYRAHGTFPNIPVARRDGNGLKLAYGHHILEAARLLGLQTIKVDVRTLSDREMIGLMPTDHGEHAKPDFMTCLVAWMAAEEQAQTDEERKPTAIARQFGWVRYDPRRPQDQPRLNDVASACHAVSEAINGNFAFIEYFRDMSPSAAHARAKEVTTSKTFSGGLFAPEFDPFKSGAELGYKKSVITDQANLGAALKSPLRYDGHANLGLFMQGVDELCLALDRMLSRNDPNDLISQRLDELAKVCPTLTTEDEINQLRRVNQALDGVVVRISNWRMKSPAMAIKRRDVEQVDEPDGDGPE